MAKRKLHELDQHSGATRPSLSSTKKSPYEDTFIARANDVPLTDFIERHVPKTALEYRSKHDRATGEDPSTVYTITPKRSRHPKSQAISDVELGACFNLIEQTSGDAYRASGFGWHPERKKREMKEEDMRYLLVTSKDESSSAILPTIGFLSFMLTYEEGHAVIYLYEIHLSPTVSGCGLGKHLLNAVEDIGRSVGVEKSMLTVFRVNEHAREWYKRAGYRTDEYSPADKKLRGGKVKQADYLILSKSLQDLG